MAYWQAWHERFIALFGDSPTVLTIGLETLAVLLGAWVAWLIVRHILTAVEKRLKDNDLVRIETRVFLIVRRAALYLLVFVTGSYLMQLLEMHFLEKGFFAAMILLLANPIQQFTMVLIRYLQRRVALRTDTQVDNIIFDLLDKFSGAAIYATAVVLAMDVLGINVMPFIAGAGVAGIAIGFAAKDTLSNLIAGVLLIIDRPFEIGDRIEVWAAPSGSATWGDVIDIGLRATKIKTTDNIVIIIPNNEIMTRDIVNYTIITSKIRVRIDIGVSYDTDIQTAKTAIVGVARSIPWTSDSPPPKVVVRNFGDSAVDLQLRVWIDDARKRMDTVSEITDRIKAVFETEGIEIPYPKRDIAIVAKNPPENAGPARAGKS